MVTVVLNTSKDPKIISTFPFGFELATDLVTVNIARKNCIGKLQYLLETVEKSYNKKCAKVQKDIEHIWEIHMDQTKKIKKISKNQNCKWGCL